MVARLLDSVFPGRVIFKEGPLTSREFLALLPQARVLHELADGSPEELLLGAAVEIVGHGRAP